MFEGRRGLVGITLSFRQDPYELLVGATSGPSIAAGEWGTVKQGSLEALPRQILLHACVLRCSLLRIGYARDRHLSHVIQLYSSCD